VDGNLATGELPNGGEGSQPLHKELYMPASRRTIRSVSFLMTACFALACPVAAQQPESARQPAPVPGATPAPATETVSGTVTSFTRAPGGEVDGFVLDDGTTVHYPPYFGKKVTGFVKDKARVRVTGMMIRGSGRTPSNLLEADSITNVTSGQTLLIAPEPTQGPGAVSAPAAGGGTSEPGGPAAVPPAAR
jgi:hypothetical protein